MDFNTYQKLARTTAVYPNLGKNLYYPTLGLCGEAGEVAEKVKKIMRDQEGIVVERNKEEIKKELGDVLWYISNSCSELNLTLEEVAQANVDKLFSRKDRNKIHGEGDNR